MMAFSSRRWLAPVSLVAMLVLAGCQTTKAPAPVEDRKASRPSVSRSTSPSTPTPAPSSSNAPAMPKAEPGTYVVKPGDTLTRISLETGQGWRDLARWNNIENPNLIEVGQVLRTGPAPTEAVATARPVVGTVVEPKPLDGKPTNVPAAQTPPAAVASAATGAASAPSAPAAREPAEDDIQWAWPASNTVIANFDEPKTKGMLFGGKAGDPVLAAADGRVIYANAGLRGYGNLIIIKHSANYLTAYAHNQALLVKEDQAVRRGQKIAEMGSSDAERVQLHFEVRRQGKPIDPTRVLPAR
ncbi:MAG: peptidase [Ideonella sp. MAG2]|nr:MAG: peptidase [Ideonella sp. MAG2]